MGVRAMLQTQRTGKLITALQVKEDQDIILVTNKGTLVRTAVDKISIVGRNTQGVRLIKVSATESLIAVACVDKSWSQCVYDL